MKPAIWQRPVFVLLCGVLIVFTSLGIRNSFGLFMRPVSVDMGWGREALSLAAVSPASVRVSRSSTCSPGVYGVG